MTEIANLTEIKIDEKSLVKKADLVLAGEGKDDAEVSIVIVGEDKIKEINNKYRKKDNPTDVLSFAFSEDNGLYGGLPRDGGTPPFYGEVVICPVYIEGYAKKFNLDYNKELARALIHGVLHLLGYDHERSQKEAVLMRKKEDYYLSQL